MQCPYSQKNLSSCYSDCSGSCSGCCSGSCSGCYSGSCSGYYSDSGCSCSFQTHLCCCCTYCCYPFLSSHPAACAASYQELFLQLPVYQLRD
ncbi:MAG TPA: hypothetical protein DCZ91_17540 [Lachnospiraceae bacterium]|nr:hypothetical protein [Lachnospiraceae bacterium]